MSENNIPPAPLVGILHHESEQFLIIIILLTPHNNYLFISVEITMLAWMEHCTAITIVQIHIMLNREQIWT